MKVTCNPQLEPTGKTYFYERPDGSIFACGEAEAWHQHKVFKQVGVSDGSVFHSKLMEARPLIAKNKRKAKSLIWEGEKLELERARGHFQEPPRQDIHGSGKEALISKL